MPSATQIHASLAATANAAVPLSVAWHAVFALALIALLRGWRPGRRTAATLLAVPLASVGVVAFAFGNAFNGTVFLALAGGLLVAQASAPEGAVHLGTPWALAAGGVMLGLGLTYPHFLEDGSAVRYLYAAPTGVVPCPTLAAVIGLALVGDGIGPRPWTVLLGGAGLFYALFGAFRLGVGLDLLLLLGAAALLARAGWPARRADPGGGASVQEGP